MQAFNVLYLIESLEVGGSEVFVERLVSRLDRSMFVPMVCCLARKGTLASRVENGGTRVMSLDWRLGSSRSTMGTVEKLTRLVRNERVDLVHSFFYRPEILGVFSARLAGAPVFLASQRDLLAPEGRIVRVFWRLADRLVTHVVANSEEGRRYRERAVGRPCSKTSVIYNGVPAEELGAGGAEAHPWQPDGRVNGEAAGPNPVITFVGRLHPVKGPDVFVRAAELVSRVVPDARFVMAGDGPARSELRDLIQRLGLDAIVTMPGAVSPPGCILKQSSLVVCPSRTESFPTVILEAMGLGVAVVAAKVGGVCELVEDGVDGFLFESENVTQLAELVVGLLRDRERAVSAGVRARRKVMTRFRFEDTVAQTEALYLRLLEGRRGSGAMLVTS